MCVLLSYLYISHLCLMIYERKKLQWGGRGGEGFELWSWDLLFGRDLKLSIIY